MAEGIDSTSLDRIEIFFMLEFYCEADEAV